MMMSESDINFTSVSLLIIDADALSAQVTRGPLISLSVSLAGVYSL